MRSVFHRSKFQPLTELFVGSRDRCWRGCTIASRRRCAGHRLRLLMASPAGEEKRKGRRRIHGVPPFPTFLFRSSPLNPLKIHGYFSIHFGWLVLSINNRFNLKLHPETWIKTSTIQRSRIQWKRQQCSSRTQFINI